MRHQGISLIVWTRNIIHSKSGAFTVIHSNSIITLHHDLQLWCRRSYFIAINFNICSCHKSVITKEQITLQKRMLLLYLSHVVNVSRSVIYQNASAHILYAYIGLTLSIQQVSLRYPHPLVIIGLKGPLRTILSPEMFQKDRKVAHFFMPSPYIGIIGGYKGQCPPTNTKL